MISLADMKAVKREVEFLQTLCLDGRRLVKRGGLSMIDIKVRVRVRVRVRSLRYLLFC
jgi:hypothetical protein